MRALMGTSDRQLLPLRYAVDRLFDTAITGPWSAQWTRGAQSAAVNVFEDADAYHVHAVVPGVNPDDLQITVQPGGVVTIAGETRPNIPAEAKAIWSEYGASQFRRDISLPAPFDADNASVAYNNGVLEMTFPKAPEARARQIKVTTTEK